MKLDYLLIYNNYFLEHISYQTFKEELYSFINSLHPSELTEFNNIITDNSFCEYNPDMVMLSYITLWLMPNRLNRLEIIYPSDNMYLAFIKSILDTYQDSFKMQPLIEDYLMYQIYQYDKIYLIINTTNTNLSITLPTIIQDQVVYCVNCNDEIKVDKQLEIYPYGFYILEKIA